MIPRIKTGRGVTGAVRYALGEGNDPATGKPRSEPKGDKSRVAWFGGHNLGFAVESEVDADLARRLMEFMALNQASRTKPCVKDCVHLSLSWRPGEEPTRAQMEEAARAALDAIGMGNARALFVAHNDEAYAHLHIVASKINPDTGRAYDLKGNYLKLSRWALDYEREHSGGIICTRREGANQLRDAISQRDAAAVLELMVKQRATFTARQLDNVLAKQIKSEFTRAQFAEKILSTAVRLSEEAAGRTSRYTTETILNAERQVLRAADGLARNHGHAVSPWRRGEILTRPEFLSLSREQIAAYTRATGAEGLALIDGQAGTGKSFTMRAIRQAYEADGCRVIGLAPTNAVAQDMEEDGFAHAATIHKELFALINNRTKWDARTVVMVDEAAMIDTKLMMVLTARAHEAGVKMILVGDDRQLSSIDHGGMFGVLKDRYGAGELKQVRRQGKPDERRAAEMMAQGNFHGALEIYDKKGAITWTRTQDEAREALVSQWAKDSAAAPDKLRFVFAYTNADVDRLNHELRAIRKMRRELEGVSHSFETKHGQADFAINDRIQFTGTDSKKGLVNGAAGTIERIEGGMLAVRLDGRGDKRVEFDAKEFKDFRHGYAGTIYKGQGRTLDETYLYHSEHWRSAASYVALTRHREKAELFVARNTAEDLKQLSRQMARVEDRRAASHFHTSGEPAPVRPVLPEQLRNLEEDLRRTFGLEPKKEGPPAASRVKSRPDWTEQAGMVAQQHSAMKAVRRGSQNNGLTERIATLKKQIEGLRSNLTEQLRGSMPETKARLVERGDQAEAKQVSSLAAPKTAEKDPIETELLRPLAREEAEPPAPSPVPAPDNAPKVTEQPAQAAQAEELARSAGSAHSTEPAPPEAQAPAAEKVAQAEAKQTALKAAAADIVARLPEAPPARHQQEPVAAAEPSKQASPAQAHENAPKAAVQPVQAIPTEGLARSAKNKTSPAGKAPEAKTQLPEKGDYRAEAAAAPVIQPVAATEPAKPVDPSRAQDSASKTALRPAQPVQAQTPPRQANAAKPPAAEQTPSTRPLDANEVAARFNDPALQARYQQQESQRQEQQKSGDPAKPVTAESVITRANVPTERQAEHQAAKEKSDRQYITRDGPADRPERGERPERGQGREDGRDGGRGGRSR